MAWGLEESECSLFSNLPSSATDLKTKLLRSTDKMDWLVGFMLEHNILTTVSVVMICVWIYSYVTCGVCKSKARLEGKTVIITGANQGLGKATAIDLARRGARVILACRNLEKANAAKDEIVKATGNENVVVKQLDVSLMSSVRKFAQDINKSEKRLDVLIHNAGCSLRGRNVTSEGLQTVWATNHFGPFLLTHLLIGVTANSLHPGAIATSIWQDNPLHIKIMVILLHFYFKTEVQGAQTTIYLAVSEDVEGVTGKYFYDCKPHPPAKKTTDVGLAKKYWEVSEEVVKLKPTDPHI